MFFNPNWYLFKAFWTLSTRDFIFIQSKKKIIYSLYSYLWSVSLLDILSTQIQKQILGLHTQCHVHGQKNH